ncbi:Chorismate mutase 3, chloroplastic [Zancudomyces culisetae]|uniref:Chorismate mutase n=1 Tax=Zancudomyces culisetae TaxID=1213189 RepID=A0A1R1PPZ9_ZANCU|nr:Chorismate mutase 3, chloroplastic [Zancudomyces culisetae]|eukprot:OMH82983.1 Chorismate mutase 3, chloroplastic [Zancudomyces culisetae]
MANLLISGPISLATLRDTLIRLEDTIIFSLIERSQFAQNSSIYKPNIIKFADGFQGSFLEWFLLEVENVHAKVRRYQSPDEYPFTKTSTTPVLEPLDYPSHLHEQGKLINVNDEIKAIYLDFVVPRISKPGDDSNYGSSATRDIECLQALSRRIHYGKFVAESKFTDPKYQEKYIELIKNKDRDAIMELLTDSNVEKKLLDRVRTKCEIFGQDLSVSTQTQTQTQDPLSNTSSGLRVSSDTVVQLYRDYIIPLTKKVEVEYLLQRLD